ncbi:hypothetical protein Tco_1042534 [Tanacetum coccineum]|uniref:Uncharacterized protein n=1 Tax=Tanacetum coccineum TaxID=301880 RepID=A0ABQ5GKG9_9ASTR
MTHVNEAASYSPPPLAYGQSIDVDAPPDIIDVVDEDDDTINEEDLIPHDLADSNDEDLVNLDIDDGVNVMSADVARGHGGDGGGDDRPPPYQESGQAAYPPRDPEPQVKGPIQIKMAPSRSGLSLATETLMPLGDHTAYWANYLGELVRELPLHYPSWRQMPPERKAGVVAKMGTQFDLRPHMESDRWPQIYAGIQQHLQKIYNGKKAALKERYWVPEEDGTYDLERLRRGRPSHISEVNWDAQLAFWNDPKNLARAAQNKQNRAKSKVMETSATREYPSLIHTFFLTHTVGGVFLNPEDKALYDEMLRLQGLGSNTPTGVPYTEDEIMAIVRGGKQRGHIPGVGRVLPGQGTVIPPPSQSTHSTDIARLKKREKQLTKQVNMFMRLFRSDDKFSQMLNQFESQPEYGGGSGSGGCGDDEPGDDEDGGEDEDDS